MHCNKLKLGHCDWVNSDVTQAIAHYCSDLRELHVEGCENLTDHDVQMFAATLPSLEKLNLGSCSKVRLSVHQLLRSASLTSLNISGTSVSRIDFPSNCKLQHLDMRGLKLSIVELPSKLLALRSLNIAMVTDGSTNVTNQLLQSCCSLEHLDISFSSATMTVLEQVLKSNKRLSSLRLGLFPLYKSPVAKFPPQLLRNLVCLDVSICSWLTDSCLAVLASCRQLRSLDVSSCPNCSPHGLLLLLSSLSNLQHLRMAATPACADALFSNLKNPPPLVSIDMSRCCDNYWRPWGPLTPFGVFSIVQAVTRTLKYIDLTESTFAAHDKFVGDLSNLAPDLFVRGVAGKSQTARGEERDRKRRRCDEI
jgi:hypothetical protein